MTLKLPSFLTPNAMVKDPVVLSLAIGWVAFLVLFWTFADIKMVPTPQSVLTGLLTQWNDGAIVHLFSSLSTSLESIAWATTLGLGLCYLATIPAFRAPVAALGKLRFLSLTGLSLYFVMFTPNGHALKVSLLAFSILTFFINDMMRVIDDIPQSSFDHARTLGFGPWTVLREVVMRGTLADALESIRMNAAMAWMMLTMVEGLSRSEGGVGVMLTNLNRSMNLGTLVGIQLMIFAVGIGQDRLIKAVKAVVCPYTNKR